MKLVSSNRPQRSIQKRYVEDYQPIDLQYDDDISELGDFGDLESEKISITKPTQSRVSLEQVLARLENIENKLTKLEGMLRTVVVNQPAATESQPAQMPTMVESVAQPITPRQGSMLGEIQSVIAQQGGIQPEMSFNHPQQPAIPQADVVSSVGTLTSGAYDDDIGEIEAFG